MSERRLTMGVDTSPKFMQTGTGSVWVTPSPTITFGTSFPATPLVFVEEITAVGVSVPSRSTIGFDWKAEVEGTAMWLAIYIP